MKILFFDVETTGLDHQTCAIVQLSGMVVIDGVLKESFNLFIKPHEGAIIKDEALSINNLTRQIVSLHPTSGEQLAAFVRTLNKYINRYDKADKFYLAGFNSRAFDEPFLRNWFLVNGNNYYGSYFWQIGLDVMVLAAEYLKHDLPSMPNFKLATVARHLGIQVDSVRLHDALYDVELTYNIYQSLQKSTDAKPLAKQALAVLNAQQNFFRASRNGHAAKEQALSHSKTLEAELRAICESIVKPTNTQKTLFDAA